jgi:hypothetical protein
MEPAQFVGDPRTEFRETESNLYLAETNTKIRASVIAAAPVRSFVALRERPYIPMLPRSEANVRKLLAAYHLWYSTRIVGDASAFDRRDIVVTGISKEIIRQLCGDSWVQMEHTYQDRPNVLALKHSISTKPTHLAAIALIAQDSAITPERAAESAIDSISRLSLTHNVLEGAQDDHFSHALVDFAYRLLNQPESLQQDGSGERMIIESLLQNPVLCRMVRFSYLIAESTEGPRAAAAKNG